MAGERPGQGIAKGDFDGFSDPRAWRGDQAGGLGPGERQLQRLGASALEFRKTWAVPWDERRRRRRLWHERGYRGRFGPFGERQTLRGRPSRRRPADDFKLALDSGQT